VEGEERAIVENLGSGRKDKENTEKERVRGRCLHSIANPAYTCLQKGHVI
jgi:hypothetical protein